MAKMRVTCGRGCGKFVVEEGTAQCPECKQYQLKVLGKAGDADEKARIAESQAAAQPQTDAELIAENQRLRAANEQAAAQIDTLKKLNSELVSKIDAVEAANKELAEANAALANAQADDGKKGSKKK